MTPGDRDQRNSLIAAARCEIAWSFFSRLDRSPLTSSSIEIPQLPPQADQGFQRRRVLAALPIPEPRPRHAQASRQLDPIPALGLPKPDDPAPESRDQLAFTSGRDGGFLQHGPTSGSHDLFFQVAQPVRYFSHDDLSVSVKLDEYRAYSRSIQELFKRSKRRRTGLQCRISRIRTANSPFRIRWAACGVEIQSSSGGEESGGA